MREVPFFVMDCLRMNWVIICWLTNEIFKDLLAEIWMWLFGVILLVYAILLERTFIIIIRWSFKTAVLSIGLLRYLLDWIPYRNLRGMVNLGILKAGDIWIVDESSVSLLSIHLLLLSQRSLIIVVILIIISFLLICLLTIIILLVLLLDHFQLMSI